MNGARRARGTTRPGPSGGSATLARLTERERRAEEGSHDLTRIRALRRDPRADLPCRSRRRWRAAAATGAAATRTRARSSSRPSTTRTRSRAAMSAIEPRRLGRGTQSGSLTATIEGPFQTDERDPTAFPQLDLTVKISGSGAGQSFNFEGGLIATEDNAFVELPGTGLRGRHGAVQAVQAQRSERVADRQAAGAAGGPGRRIGLRAVRDRPPELADQRLERGHEDVEGTETIHIHGDADVDADRLGPREDRRAEPGAARPALDAGPARPGRGARSRRRASTSTPAQDDKILRKLASR